MDLSLVTSTAMLFACVLASTIALAFFNLKHPLVRWLAAALTGAFLFQLTNRIHLGFWDPFSVIAFFISAPICFIFATVIEIIYSKISQKDTDSKSPNQGFTLIEILIVLVILAVVAGLVTLSIGGDERGTLQREAQRLTGALEYAADRARFRHEIVGVSALPDGRGWRFWTIPEDAGKNVSWRAIADDATLAARRLPDPLTLRPLHYAGQPLAADAIVPLLPAGRSEPYAFELRGTGWSLQLNGDPLGRIFATLPAVSGTMP